MSKPLALLVNDDGVHAPGIKALHKSLSQVAEVYMCAPHVERSAVSQAITIHNPLRVEKLSEKVFAVEGTPADCVKLAMGELLPYKPDFIVSGINRGPNLGMDTLYSGTVSAALEGALFDVPGLAVSSYGPATRSMYYETAAKVAVNVFQTVMPNVGAQRVLNLNVPSCPVKEIKGVKFTALGRRLKDDKIIKSVDPRGRPYYWLGGGFGPIEERENSDMLELQRGFATLSVLRPCLFDEDGTSQLASKVPDLEKLLT